MIRSSILTIVLVIITHSVVFAQMFSVDSEDEKGQSSVFTSTITGGVELLDYTYTGGSGSQPLYQFEDPLYAINLDMNYLEIKLGFGFNAGQNENLEVFKGVFGFKGGQRLYKTEQWSITLPLILQTETFNVTLSQGFNSEDNSYDQTGFLIGSGLQTKYVFDNGWSVKARGHAKYGYATHSFGSVTGDKWEVAVKGEIHSFTFSPTVQLVAGYEWTMHAVDLDGSRFDYDGSGQLITIGITF